MFKRSFRSRDASASQREAASTTMDSQHRVDKSSRLMRKGTGRDAQKVSKLQRSLNGEEASRTQSAQTRLSDKSLAPSPIITLVVGREARLFAAHEDVLRQAPFFDRVLSSNHVDAQNRRISLPDEEPEVFSAILEYLYKGDYYPRLLHNKHRNSWELEDSLPRRATPHTSPTIHESPKTGGGRAGHTPQTPSAVEATVFLSSIGQHLLRDTVIYCAAERYGLEELKRLALRKQGLQSGIDVGTILRSAQYCYANTPDSDSRLRAHYLALIIRCRKTFKRSGTMQAEMEKCGSDVYGDGSGKLFFDLFVAMCNHLDDVIEASNARTPKTI
ncbi:BTB domain-containing protein [Madurella fahalii]|uniref:BTB domain-containing protein n=1 Tax=Madurella fahalii TaxID=1157608 RepID=A0ABQ0GNL8_9PEZI